MDMVLMISNALQIAVVLFRPDVEVYLMHNSHFRKEVERRPVGTNLLIFHWVFFPSLGMCVQMLVCMGCIFVCLLVFNFSFKSNLPNLYSLVIVFWIGIWSGTRSSSIAIINSHPALPIKKTKIIAFRVMYDLSAAHWQSRQEFINS